MEDEKCNDVEAVENYGQKMRVFMYDKDRNPINACTSKYPEQENNNEKWYLYEYISKKRCKKYCRDFFSTNISQA